MNLPATTTFKRFEATYESAQRSSTKCIIIFMIHGYDFYEWNTGKEAFMNLPQFSSMLKRLGADPEVRFETLRELAPTLGKQMLIDVYASNYALNRIAAWLRRVPGVGHRLARPFKGGIYRLGISSQETRAVRIFYFIPYLLGIIAMGATLGLILVSDKAFRFLRLMLIGGGFAIWMVKRSQYGCFLHFDYVSGVVAGIAAGILTHSCFRSMYTVRVKESSSGIRGQ